jgi:uncharacterized NAD(P)/FAD-binding protein YdhS
MTKTLIDSPLQALESAIALSQDIKTQTEAHQAFNEVYEAVRANHPQMATMLQMLWREYVTTQRSAAFWQELCQVEKHLSDRITESHVQLRQNYLRLMHEQ